MSETSRIKIIMSKIRGLRLSWVNFSDWYYHE
jgi:hypothetical protein